MNLTAELDSYLELRRSLGFKLERPGHLLRQFVHYLESCGAEVITSELALKWAMLPTGANPYWHATRLSVVRSFARHLAAIDPANEIPLADVLPRTAHRAIPFVYSAEDISVVMREMRKLSTPFKAATYGTLIGLLAITGMRVGEAISLDCADVDLGRGVSTIRHSKFDKSREVPILPSVASALACYAELRVERFPRATPFFVSLKGTRLFYKNVHFVYHETVKRVGIASSLPGCRPRVHDLRHSFAIRAMARIEAIDDRDAAEAARVRLSTYLGHFDVSSTYWYLEATPELLGPALRKLEARKAEEP